MRTREITIGTVRSDYFVCVANAGYPNGYAMYWRGRIQPFQPLEFVAFGDLLWAIKRRLEFARLQLVTIFSLAQKDSAGHAVLRVEVRRRRLLISH